jgi:plastocyanin
MPRRRYVGALAGATLWIITPAAQAHAERVGAFENYFHPKKVEVQVGEKVRWRNRMGTHSVVMKSGGQDVDSVISGDADVTSKRFKDPGTFRYICRIHVAEGMKGKVVVEPPSGGKH